MICKEIEGREPRDFDIVLLHSMGFYNHVGVVVFVNGRMSVLHSFAGARQVCLTGFAQLSNYHLSPAGFYECL